jgi:hypothetical protein
MSNTDSWTRPEPELSFTLTVEVYDLGEREPDWHKDLGPWYRWEARITDGSELLAQDAGFIPAEAIWRAAGRLTTTRPEEGNHEHSDR